MKKHVTQRGFTLLEVLIYIALFGLLMSGAVVSAFQLLESGQRQDISFAAQQEGTFVNRKLAWALAPATAVSVSGGNKLTISRPDLGTTLIVDASSTPITFARGTNPAVPLTSSGLTVENTHFVVLPPANGLPTAVELAYTLGGKEFTYSMYLRK